MNIGHLCAGAALDYSIAQYEGAGPASLAIRSPAHGLGARKVIEVLAPRVLVIRTSADSPQCVLTVESAMARYNVVAVIPSTARYENRHAFNG